MPVRIGYSIEAGYDLVNNNGIELDDTLETAVIVSLFTDARATDDELRLAGLPLDDHRGFWGDTYPEVEGDVTGSKLWLLARAKRTDQTLAQAKQYAEDALAWLLEDGIADSVTCDASWFGATGPLVLAVEIQRPGQAQPRWKRLWNAISGELMEAA